MAEGEKESGSCNWLASEPLYEILSPSRQYLFHDTPVDIGQAHVAAAERVGELGVVQSQ